MFYFFRKVSIKDKKIFICTSILNKMYSRKSYLYKDIEIFRTYLNKIIVEKLNN